MRTWLTGVGAMTLASALVFAVLFELWSRGMLEFPEGRPTLEVGGLPAYAFGAAVAVRAGGWRGVLLLIVLASLWMVMAPFVGADRDFFVRQLWAYAGIGLGVFLAAVHPVHVSSTAFVGAGAYGIATAAYGVLPTLVFQTGSCQTDTVGLCVGVSEVLLVIFNVVGGIAAGLIIGRSIPLRVTVLLALTIALPSAVVTAHQGWMWQDLGFPSLLGMASGVIGGATLVLAALLAPTAARRGVSGQLLRRILVRLLERGNAREA